MGTGTMTSMAGDFVVARLGETVAGAGQINKSNEVRSERSSALTATQVGARREAPVILTVDAAAGHAFYQGANGVWLTDHVPPSYLLGWPTRA
jgi:RNA:NAD 2'-phosphotransferase (TPT1/KptA family)